MRLYKRHDADLLCLKKQENYTLQKTIKCAVLAYLDNVDVKFDYPSSAMELEKMPSTLQFNLYLSKESSDDIRIKECLKAIPSGYKNSFLKNITRYYLARPSMFTFNNETVKFDTERASE